MPDFPQNPPEGYEVVGTNGAVWRWDGRRWIAVAPPSINAITAGVGLGGGGSQGDVEIYLRDTSVVPGNYTNTNLTVDQQGRILSAADGVVEGGFLPRGTLGMIAWGVHFRDDRQGGLPTLQEYLDEHVNGHWFELGPHPEPGSINLIIAAGSAARAAPITIRDVFMQGLTLVIQTHAQFAGTLTISGLSGSLNIGGTAAWGSGTNFATHINLQNITGSVTFSGVSPTKRFNDVSLFGCPDVRFDAGTNEIFMVAGTLTVQNSNLRLDGQGSAYHSYTTTNLDSGSRLDISNSLGNAAVQLGGGRRQGWIFDRRTGQALDTFARAGTSGPVTLGGDLSVTDGIATVVALQGHPVAEASPAAAAGLMWTASGWAPGQFMRRGDSIPALTTTLAPVSLEHEGTTHELGAVTVQGAIQNLFEWFITDVQPGPEPPPAQIFDEIALSTLSFQTGLVAGVVIAQITVALLPSYPAFSGSLALSGPDAAAFQIQGTNLVAANVTTTGEHNITITASQAGLTPPSLAQTFTLIGGEAGVIPALPSVPPGQSGLDFSWTPGPDSVGVQTAAALPNVPFQCRVVRAVVRLTTSSTTAVQGWVTHYDNSINPPSGDHVQISDFFQLNQAPALIEVTGLQTTRIVNVGDWLHFRATSGAVPVTSAATARIFIQSTTGEGIPPLPDALPGETALNGTWIANGERLNEQTWLGVPFDCVVSRAYVRLTTSNTTPQEAALAYYIDQAPSGIDISDRFALNQPPGLIEVTGIQNVTIPAGPGNNTIYFRSTGPTGSITSAGTVRVFVHPPGAPPGGDGDVPPLPAVPAGQIGLDSSWVAGAGTLSQQTMTGPGNVPQNSQIVRAVIRITGPDTVASEAAVRWLPAGAGAAITMSNLAPLAQAPGLVEVGGLNTTQIVAAGEHVYWGAMGAIVNANSTASGRIYLQPTGGGIPPLPSPEPGQTAFDVAWVPGGGRLNEQTIVGPAFTCRVVRAVVRLTTPNVTPGNGFLGYFITGSPGGFDMSDPFALNQSAALIEVTGIDTNFVLPGPGNVLYFRSGDVVITSAATARIFVVPA